MPIKVSKPNPTIRFYKTYGIKITVITHHMYAVAKCNYAQKLIVVGSKKVS